MRETCTSGSVRGEGGNLLTYSAQQGWGIDSQHCPSVVGAAHFHLKLHQYSVEKHFQDEPAELQIPIRLRSYSLMKQCRTYGARVLFGIGSPALPGWADVWRSALRASHPWRLPVSFLSQVVAGSSVARDHKGEGNASLESRC